MPITRLKNYLKMSDTIEIKIDNKQIESKLLDLAKRSENLRPLMKNIEVFSLIHMKKTSRKKDIQNGKT